MKLEIYTMFWPKNNEFKSVLELGFKVIELAREDFLQVFGMDVNYRQMERFINSEPSIDKVSQTLSIRRGNIEINIIKIED